MSPPRAGGAGTQGRSRAARAPTPPPARSRPGWPGGRARRGLQRGRGSRGDPRQGGLGPRRGDARFPRLCPGAAPGRPQPSGRGLGALGAGIARQGGARGGGKGARVGKGADWANLGAAPRPRARGDRGAGRVWRRPPRPPGLFQERAGPRGARRPPSLRPGLSGRAFRPLVPPRAVHVPDPPTRASPGTEPQAEKGRSGPGAAGAGSVPVRSFPPLPEGPGRLGGSRGAGTRFQLV